MNKKFKSLENLIGNTPLLEISFKYKNEYRKLYSKAEYYNYTGSIKDRIVFYILKKSYENDLLKNEDVLIEATSGNTGISLSAIGSFLGHKVKIYMPEWMSEERKKLMTSFGAELVLVSKEQGGVKGASELVKKELEKDGYFSIFQFDNQYNVETHYFGTAIEIEKQLSKLNQNIDVFTAGVGTGGTVMGVNKYFKKNDKFKTFPIEPENSAVLSGSTDLKGHKIQGIGAGFFPKIVDLTNMETPITVNDDDAIRASQLLSRNFGLGVGISAGANLIGADKTVVTVFPDDNKKYLSTDYSKDIEIKDNFISKDIELLDIVAIK